MRVVSSGNIYYYEEDMLGSSRTMVQAGQTAVCGVYPERSRRNADFYPFGGERDITNTCTQNYKFEGKERDTETGNDDFGARYYTSRLGRWLSADWSAVPAPVPYANLTNPQTLNLYAMVSDNPETFADLEGHDGGTCTPVAGATSCATKSSSTPPPPGEGNTGDGTKKSTTQQVQTDIYELNGVVTVETSVTTTTTDSKGNKVTTVTNTQAFFSAKKGHEGAFLGAQQTTFTGSIFNRSQQHLTLAQATQVLGSKAIYAATVATAPGFGTELGRDIQAHPRTYLMHAIGFAVPAFELGDLVEGAVTGVEALKSGIDLEKEMHEGPDQ